MPAVQDKPTSAPASDADGGANAVPMASADSKGNAVLVAFTPELIEPGLQIPSGDFVVTFADADFARIVFKPGLNFDLSTTLWQRAKTLPQVQELMQLNALQEIVLEGGPGPSVSVLKREPEALANTLVIKCRDQRQLETWLGVEERMSVRNSIQRRLNNLNEGKG
jgi:hypothetical protein